MGEIKGKQDTVSYGFSFPRIKSLEHAFYVSNEQNITPSISVNYGLRFSVFSNIGEGTVEEFERVVGEQRVEYNVTGEEKYGKGEIYHTYTVPEPRIGATFVLSDKHSIKASYSRTAQYLFVASNSSVETPIDVWICSNPNIKPQTSDQYTAGYFRNFLGNMLETSVEVYYKEIQNQIQFREFAMPQFNEHIIEDLRVGVGKAYGVELLIKKPGGRLNGWVSYAYSVSKLKIKDIQEKGWYPSPYDRPHDFTVVAIYQHNKRISLSSNFTFKSGNPITAPSARFEYGSQIVPYYSGRNQSRVPAYHRLDFAMTYKIKDRKHWQGEWVFSVYNVYANKNPDAIYFERDDENPYKTRAMQTTYFTFFPSVSFNFTF